jgi:TRAP-type C4-dicarboxylate transport system substrate-binding protein
MSMTERFVPFVAGALMAAVGFSAAAQETTLKAASAFDRGSNQSSGFEKFIERVNAESKGTIQLNYLGGGGALMNPFELGSALSKGVVEIGVLPGSFYTTLMPEADALKMVMMPMKEVRKSGKWEFFNDIHNRKVNAHWLGRTGELVPFHLYLTKKIDKMDLSGLRIRVTPIYRPFFTALGANVVQTAPGEVYTALERGVVDGYGWPIQGVFDLGWQRVTKFRVDPGFYNSSSEILVNLDVWKKLTAAQKQALEKGRDWLEDNFAPQMIANNAVEAKRQNEAGIQTIAFTGEDAKKYLKLADDSAWDAIVKANPETGPRLRQLYQQ